MKNIQNVITQQKALDLLMQGKNVFLTGSAGTGKTFTLEKFITLAKDSGKRVAITASTGIAATHINGITIHSWSGIGIKRSFDELNLQKLIRDPNLWCRITYTDVLIIDEISMLHPSQLEMINKICKQFRDSDEPFGGIQVVLCGDFFQLPPVIPKGEETIFAFESHLWEELDLKICYLAEQFRQNDLEFLKILNSIRDNNVTLSTLAPLQERMNKPIKKGIIPIKLYTHNCDIDVINQYELDKLSGKEYTHFMTSSGEYNFINNLKRNCLAPEIIKFKIGAVVMFVKNNYSKGFVNGTMGTIIGFNTKGYPSVRTSEGIEIIASPEYWMYEENDEVKARIKQIPLRLAWGITIHKSQGFSFDAAEIDLSKAFSFGMGYVALSRVKSLDGITLKGLNDIALKVDPVVSEFDLMLQEKSRLEALNFPALSNLNIPEQTALQSLHN